MAAIGLLAFGLGLNCWPLDANPKANTSRLGASESVYDLNGEKVKFDP